jgi:hypothetical protein
MHTYNEETKPKMERTGNVKSRMTFHTMPPCHSIFDSRRQRMSEMKGSRYIGRWNDHDKLILRFFVHGKFGVARVKAFCFPPILPGGFDGGGVVSICHGDLGEILLFALGCVVDEYGLGRRSLGLLFLAGFVPSLFYLLFFVVTLLKVSRCKPSYNWVS